VGYAFCLAVPPRHHARTFALATLVLAFAGLVFDVGSVLIPRQPLQLGQPADIGEVDQDPDESTPDAAPEPTTVLLLGGLKTLLVDYCRHFAFLFFLWAVALMYEGNDLIRDATQLLVFEGIAFAWWAVNGLLWLVGVGQAVQAIGHLPIDRRVDLQ
jgi:hypothetical protein